MALLLGLKGYRSASFESAEHLLASFRPEWRGCVVTDVDMPGMSGLELQAALARMGGALPVIVMSASCDPNAQARALAAGRGGIRRQAFRCRPTPCRHHPRAEQSGPLALRRPWSPLGACAGVRGRVRRSRAPGIRAARPAQTAPLRVSTTCAPGERQRPRGGLQRPTGQHRPGHRGCAQPALRDIEPGGRTLPGCR